MSSIGPTLPPQLTSKRKREDEDGELGPAARVRSRSSSSSSGGDGKRHRVLGPSLPPSASPSRIIGPSLPQNPSPIERPSQPAPSPVGPSLPPATASAQRPLRPSPNILGPSLPPAPLDERPVTDPNSDSNSDSDDDGFGPAPPPAAGSAAHYEERERQRAFEAEVTVQETISKPQREEWMLAPPTSGDWSSRVDPTKLRNRKFNTGKSARAPAGSGGDSALWTETPEEKRKRLEDEVMGVSRTAGTDAKTNVGGRATAEERETERRIREYDVSYTLISCEMRIILMKMLGKE